MQRSGKCRLARWKVKTIKTAFHLFTTVKIKKGLLAKGSRLLFSLTLILSSSSSFALFENNESATVFVFNSAHSYLNSGKFFYNPDKQRIHNNALASVRLINEGDLSPRIQYGSHVISQLNYDDRNLIGSSTGNIFRAKSLEWKTIDENNHQWLQSVDQLYLETDYLDFNLKTGRLPISFGSGRLWQPLDVYGAFPATTLDREFKPGVDQVTLEYFPTDLSSLNINYVFSPLDDSRFADSQTLFFQTQLLETAMFSFLLGNVQNRQLVGSTLELEWLDAGWRVEFLAYEASDSEINSLYAIAGFDYQFENELLWITEIYHNSDGASSRKHYEVVSQKLLYVFGALPQLSQNLIGTTLQKTISPLLSLNYTLLVAGVKNDSSYAISSLHQFAGIYSTSNESDLWISLLSGTGNGLNNDGNIESEFGHIPASLSIRYRVYF